MLKPQDYKNALIAQSAINLSGLVHEFSTVVHEIWEEAHEIGEATSWVNTHPISRLYAEQIAHLSGGGGCDDAASYVKAYAECQKRAKEPVADTDKKIESKKLTVEEANARVLKWGTDRILGTRS